MGEVFFQYIQALLKDEPFITQTSKAEQSIISKYALGKKIAIEIGVFQAVNTILISESIGYRGVVYGIDPFFSGKLGISWNEKIAELNIRRRKKQEIIKLIKAFSFNALPLIKLIPDFIFIDGDHSWDGIRKDWELYSKLLEPGGVILLHDTSVPDSEPWKASYDSTRFFNEVIIKTPGFIHLECVESLNVLKKINKI